MSKRTNIVLLTLLLLGFGVYWAADLAKIPTAKQRAGLADLAVPALQDVQPGEIDRIEITATESGAPALIALERGDSQDWSVVQPTRALAKAGQADALIANLKRLRAMPGSRGLSVDPATSGLKPPLRVVRLLNDQGQALATIELGRTLRKLEQFVRVDGAIHAVDANVLKMAFEPVHGWRERGLLATPTHAVESVSVEGPNRRFEAKRSNGKWRISEPIRALGDEIKMEGLLADLVGLRVDGEKDEGFVADGVADFAPYGLDKPGLTVTLTLGQGKPLRVAIGKEPANRPGHVFARRLDQNSVVIVNGERIRDLGLPGSVNAVRGSRLFDMQPRQADFVEIEDHGRQVRHRLVRHEKGWRVTAPATGEADPLAIIEFLKAVNELETLTIQPESEVNRPELDPPSMTIRVWENSRSQGDVPSAEPSVNLKLGRHDPLRKVVYGRIAGDSFVLSLLEKILDVVPQGELAFLDRTVLRLANERFVKFVFEAPGKRIAIEGKPGDAAWTMTAPVDGAADMESVRNLTNAFSRLRAQRLLTRASDPKALKSFGLETPQVTASWATESGKSGKLEIGALVMKGRPERFAKLAGDDKIFTIDGNAIAIINQEHRDRAIFAFNERDARRIELIWPTGRISFEKADANSSWSRDPQAAAKGELRAAPAGLDPAKLDDLVKRLASLRAERYHQYEGAFPAPYGLAAPSLTVRIRLQGERGFQLRVGGIAPEGRIATNEGADSGIVFSLTGAFWAPWIQMAPELPEDVFAPASP